jgi:1,4-alpha-glucan branching enzyme
MLTEALTPATAPVLAVVFPSNHAGMGANPYEGGTAFRVWAPFADAVYLAGSFNDWSAHSQPLAKEGNGHWSCDVAGVGPGDRYVYVICNGERTFKRTDPYALALTSSGRTIITDPRLVSDDDAFRVPPWHELVIYELHTGTFNDRTGGRPGTFRSVIRKLDYLQELGVNAIELMPAMEFHKDFSWGYNPAHIFAIESAYGGPHGLHRLVRAAHERGIAVIIDVVYNHFGPEDLDLWRFDGWSENEKGGIYFYNDTRSKTPWGDTRPDYGRPEVSRFIRDNALYWLERCRIDGLRWDATAYIRNRHGNNDDPAHDIPDGWAMMRAINDEIDARQPWKLQIAEDLRGNPWITRATTAGGAGFDTQWDDKFVHPVRAALITRADGDRDMYAVRDAIRHRYGPNALTRVIYTESHDEVANGKARVPEEIWPDNAASWASRKRSTLGAALVFTSPGIPMLFQGQEFLEDAWFHDKRPLDWSRTRTYAGILNLYRDLIRLRRNWYNHTRGLSGQHVNVFHVNDQDKVIAFHRWENGGARDDVVLICNFANRAYDSYTLGFPRSGRWRVRFNSDWGGYGADFGNHFSYDTMADGAPKDGLPTSGNVGVGPYSVIILSQDA